MQVYRHSISAERMGVYTISIDGLGCGGQPGEDDLLGLVLIPTAADRLRRPLYATGDIGDRRSLVAAMTLGAAGNNMGTRFYATFEAPIHSAVNELIVATDERATNFISGQFRDTGRVAKTSVSDKVVALSAQPAAQFKDIPPCADLIETIVRDAEAIITEPSGAKLTEREAA